LNGTGLSELSGAAHVCAGREQVQPWHENISKRAVFLCFSDVPLARSSRSSNARRPYFLPASISRAVARAEFRKSSKVPFYKRRTCSLSIVFLYYGFLSLAKTLRAQRVSSRYKSLYRSAVCAPLRGISFWVAACRARDILLVNLCAGSNVVSVTSILCRKARGLIAKIPRSRRWRVTQKGWRVLGPLVETCA
jgi:hypothetical protein